MYVPYYNAGQYLKKCLQAVLNQSYPVDEIIVVDDGSSESCQAIIKNLPVRLINNNVNQGLAATRNIAIKEARNNFIAAVDADCQLKEDWLKECMRYFDNPENAAVGGQLHELNSRGIANTWRQVHLKHHWGPVMLVNPPFLSGSNTVIRKDVISTIGFYNDDKYRNNYEDVDLSLRLKKTGFNLVYEPKAQALHLRRDSVLTVMETFWKWKFWDFKRKYLIRPLFNLVNSLKLTLEDILAGNYSLIFMDVLTFVFCTYFDLRKALGNK